MKLSHDSASIYETVWVHAVILCLSFMVVWSFIVSTISDPGYIQVPPLPPDADPSQLRKKCPRCMHPKPVRAYHCSKCNRCIFRMDHHCVWIGNCVGYLNQKPFILFLLYTLLLSSISLLMQAIKFYRWTFLGTFQFTSALCESALFLINVFTLAVVRGYFSDQLEALETNTTLIETYKEVKGGGELDAFRQIFGDRAFLWLFPVRTTSAPDYLERVHNVRSKFN